ncbi:MAG: DUF4832 domain-containing protein [Chitinophagaceae bacterium]|nr:DUF4832 domain-containing protein [Chitinophagaceae bacterium]
MKRVVIFILCLLCVDRAMTQDWSHYVRTAGHGLHPGNISATIKDAKTTYLYGIEVDNDITGRYESFLDPTEKLRAIKAMADSAHAIDNYAFVYIAGLEIITSNSDTARHSFFKDHPDWVQRNIKGEPAIFGGGDAFWISKGDEDAWISPYALEWRKIYMERIRQITATGIDGIYIDIPYWMCHFEGWEDSWASFDKYTVAAFKKKTGINALKQVKIGDWNDPHFVAWINFRKNTIADFVSEVKENIKRVNPGCKLILEIYPGLSEAVARIGTDNYQLYKIADVIAHEYSPRDKDYVDGGGGNSSRSDPSGWMRYMIAMYTFRAMAEGKPTWMLSYSWDGEEKIIPSDAIKNLFVSQVMSGTNPWDAARHVMSGSNDYDARTQVYKWIKENEQLIYSKRETISPVGVYFSPNTRDYFSDSWERSYFGTMEFLMQKGIEFEIVTPATLNKFSSGLLIFPDVKSLGTEELAEIENILKQGRKQLVFTGNTGDYDGVRKKVEKNPVKLLVANYKQNATLIEDDPGSDFDKFMKMKYDSATYNDKEPQHEGSKSYSEIETILGKYYLPTVAIKGGTGCVSQVALLNGKPTVYIANFTGLRSKENAIPIPRRDVTVTFYNLPSKAVVVNFISFLEKPVQLKGVWNGNDLTVSLPAFLRGAIITLGDAPLVLQKLDYTEDPVDIPNPDRGFYRGRWQAAETPFGRTPEVDHRVPVDAKSPLYHGRQMPPVEGDDIEKTEVYNRVNVDPYVGGTGVSALPSIAFMGFDLCNFSSNAFLSRQSGLDYDADPGKGSAKSFERRTGKTQPLTPYALAYIRGLLQKVRDGNGVAFVKFSYDGNGFNYVEGKNEHLILGPEPNYVTANNPSAMCNVPGYTNKNWVEYHILQLKPILHEFEDVIMCVKAGMFGPWGEMHTSPVARDPKEYKKLYDAYLDAVPASRPILGHAGAFLAWYNLTYNTHYNFSNIDGLPVPPKGSPESRFGYFNDSYAAGSWDDHGSLSEGARMFSPDGADYDRYKTISWINKQDQIVQGEGGIGNNVFGNMPGAILEAQQLRTTNLNMRHGNYSLWSNFVYNRTNVTTPVTFPANGNEKSPPYTGQTKTAFFDQVYDGKNGLEYFRDRMGYRLLLREAKVSEWVAQDGILKFQGKIQNVGFGNVVNKKRVSVILKAKDGSNSYAAITNVDARNWLTAENGDTRADNTTAWRDLKFSIDMHTFGNIPPGAYDIFLKINDPGETSANRRCIRFANKGNSWNAELGANLIGSTKVL